MRKILLILSIALMGCEIEPTYTRNYVVVTSVDDNWTTSKIECDSVNMLSVTHIEIYVDGSKSNIHAGQIKVWSNHTK